jgi:hypothetical protein
MKLGYQRTQAYRGVQVGLKRGAIEHTMPAIFAARDRAHAALASFRSVRRVQVNRDNNHSEWIDLGGEA